MTLFISDIIGNVTETVNTTDLAFFGAANIIHHQFQNSPTLKDVTVRYARSYDNHIDILFISLTQSRLNFQNSIVLDHMPLQFTVINHIVRRCTTNHVLIINQSMALLPIMTSLGRLINGFKVASLNTSMGRIFFCRS